MAPGHLPPRTIPIRVTGDYAVLKFFTVFHFIFVTIRYFIDIRMNFFKTYDRFSFRIISEIFEFLSKV